MPDEWMPSVQLPVSPELFRQLPRSPAYRYTWLDGVGWINPRPRYFHAALDLQALQPCPAPQGVLLRSLRSKDWGALASVFADAFADDLPFAGLDDDRRLAAASKCLAQTRAGGDGPWIEAASFVAHEAGGPPLGAALATVVPPRDPSGWESYHWDEPPPDDCIRRRLGRPHLTWVFVTQSRAGRGIGTALLSAMAAALVRMGFAELVTTFLLGNHSSMLWHWRCGFRLLSHPASRRGAD